MGKRNGGGEVEGVKKGTKEGGEVVGQTREKEGKRRGESGWLGGGRWVKRGCVRNVKIAFLYIMKHVKILSYKVTLLHFMYDIYIYIRGEAQDQD